jgi:DNA mismatch repair protein MutS
MTLHDNYFEEHKKYYAKYGEKTVVLIEIGAFFEIYKVDNSTECVGPDIHSVCDICNLQLSRKNKAILENNRGNPMMAGFPSHSFAKHVQLLLNAQYTLVIIRQVTQPPNPKREVTEILSPSMQMSPTTVEGNYLMVTYWDSYIDSFKKRYLSLGLCGFDVSTGETWVYEVASTPSDPSLALDELVRFYQMYQPREVVFLSGPDILPEECQNIQDSLGITYDTTRSFHLLWNMAALQSFRSVDYQNALLKKAYSDCKSMLTPLEYLNMELYENARVAFTYMIQFAYEHNQTLIQYLKVPQQFSAQHRCILDYNSAIQLQILSQQTGERPLLSILNRCATSFGSRHFKELLLQPSYNIEYLTERYDKTEHIIKNRLFDIIHSSLRKVLDIERMGRRMILGQFAPADWSSFDSSMIALSGLCEVLMNTYDRSYAYLKFDSIHEQITHVMNEYKEWLVIDECSKYIMTEIKSNIFIYGKFAEIDKIQDDWNSTYKMLEYLCEYFKESCRIEYNERDGYVIVITKKRWESVYASMSKTAQIELKYDIVLDGKKQKKTENLILKDFQIKPLSATSTIVRIKHPWIENKSDSLIKLSVKLSQYVQKEYKKFLNDFALKTKDILRMIIQNIADIDVLTTNARNAVEFKYSKPIINTTNEKSCIIGKKVRHPILERILFTHEYIPNDIDLNDNQLGLLLFGMNASGKSSFMKAIGLNIVMAQAGMYVPSESLKYTPYHHIFTRISGADNIYRGWSSFTVEMMELRNILQRCNQYSLVLGDELCAGTESISAIAIVTAGIDALVKKEANFVFATHLHDLSQIQIIQNLEERGTIRLAHMHVEVDKNSGRLLFDRQLRDGTGSALYGLEVCHGLGLPSDFLKKAHEVRSEFEKVSPFLQSTKESRYNSKVLVQKCGVCHIALATEVHHIREQHTADENGFIDHIHKNNAANLVPLCESCHQKTHHRHVEIAGYVQTDEGIILQTHEKELVNINLEDSHTIYDKIVQDKIRELLYQYIRYNNSKWFLKKTVRSKWKEIKTLDELIKITCEYIQKSKFNESKAFIEIFENKQNNHELINEFANIMNDPLIL